MGKQIPENSTFAPSVPGLRCPRLCYVNSIEFNDFRIGDDNIHLTPQTPSSEVVSVAKLIDSLEVRIQPRTWTGSGGAFELEERPVFLGLPA